MTASPPHILAAIFLGLALPIVTNAGEKLPKVLVIGVDGLAPVGVTAEKMPVLVDLGERGRLDLDATNCWTEENIFSGQSAPNWATCLTGVNPAEHKVARNGDRMHVINDGREGAVASIFGRLKAAHPHCTTALVNTWKGIGIGQGSILGSSGEVIDHHFRAAEPADIPAGRDARNVEAACGLLAQPELDFLFVHLGNVDSMGHKHGWGSEPYLEACKTIDTHIGELLAAVEARSSRREESWMILLTSDHGGRGNDHKDNADPLNRTIPFLVFYRSRIRSPRPGHRRATTDALRLGTAGARQVWSAMRSGERCSFGCLPKPVSRASKRQPKPFSQSYSKSQKWTFPSAPSIFKESMRMGATSVAGK